MGRLATLTCSRRSNKKKTFNPLDYIYCDRTNSGTNGLFCFPQHSAEICKRKTCGYSITIVANERRDWIHSLYGERVAVNRIYIYIIIFEARRRQSYPSPITAKERSVWCWWSPRLVSPLIIGRYRIASLSLSILVLLFCFWSWAREAPNSERSSSKTLLASFIMKPLGRLSVR